MQILQQWRKTLTVGKKMIHVHDYSKPKRIFVLYKSLTTEDGTKRVTVWFAWMTRFDNDCASWLWVSDDGQRFIECTGH